MTDRLTGLTNNTCSYVTHRLPPLPPPPTSYHTLQKILFRCHICIKNTWAQEHTRLLGLLYSTVIQICLKFCPVYVQYRFLLVVYTFTGGFFGFFLYFINISTCRPSDSTSKDAGIDPKAVATMTLAVRRSNHSARSHPHPARSHPHSARSHPQLGPDLVPLYTLVGDFSSKKMSF